MRESQDKLIVYVRCVNERVFYFYYRRNNNNNFDEPISGNDFVLGIYFPHVELFLK